ncbi:hypothetical protein P7K49_031436 [Saguinus oedipus]|uniref:40S ribosomal protein S15 n=1 Tax=Saguinus oedipus TaxID=9490 RepID=A0ABQ9U076_SAGOE|nr:hypothetical protein P7K49_031436 [Saguinus oedipus]
MAEGVPAAIAEAAEPGPAAEAALAAEAPAQDHEGGTAHAEVGSGEAGSGPAPADAINLPEMVGSMVGVYNGKTFNQVEIKPEIIGHYLGEFSITFEPVKQRRPGTGATHSTRFIPLEQWLR